MVFAIPMKKMRVAKGPAYPTWFGVRVFSRRKWLLVVVFALLALTRSATAASAGTEKNILVLYSFSERSVTMPIDSLESALRAKVSFGLNFYVEYLEAQRFADNGYRQGLVDALRGTYGGQKLDLVITESYPALQFALEHRDELFRGVPIVFYGVDSRRIAGQQMGPGVTGVTETVGVRATIDLALHLHPNTTTVAVITNGSEYERYWLTAVHAELLRHENEVREIDLVSLPTGLLLEKIATLPVQTIVLFQEAPQQSVRPAIGAYEILSRVGQRLPTYCIFPVLCLNRGGIGGAESDGREQIALAADLVGRVLSGERPESIPLVSGTDARVEVDWRQLRRWNIPESALPPGTVVLYRQPNFWERDREYILAAVVLIVALALLMQRARKRKAEAVLRESEKRFRLMADTTPAIVWMCDAQGKITYLNERRIAFTGPDSKEGYGDTWAAYVHPDDLKNVLDTVSEALRNHQSLSMEYRLRRSDGVYRWMFDVASPRLNGDGSFGGFIGSAIDTTDQKLAQQALENVSGQLIEAQEKERSRIARDLHDDICQRLALLSMELGQVNRSSNGSSETMKKSLEDIRKHCSEIAGDVQALSHQLHSSKLDYLGIVSAIRGFCAELSKQHELNIEFSERNVPAQLPKDVSLCLFRIAQEALHNAVKYSGVSEFTVDLSGVEGAVQLMISDAGAGFDVEEAKKNRGLGLLSMQERIHLVHGTFSVESRRGLGTRIIAVVPFIAENEWSPEDGHVKEASSARGVPLDK
jgi:PAS domain S-box-containing protein